MEKLQIKFVIKKNKFLFCKKENNLVIVVSLDLDLRTSLVSLPTQAWILKKSLGLNQCLIKFKGPRAVFLQPSAKFLWKLQQLIPSSVSIGTLQLWTKIARIENDWYIDIEIIDKNVREVNYYYIYGAAFVRLQLHCWHKKGFYGPEVVSLESESFYHKVSSVLSSSSFCLNENLSMLVSEKRHKRLTTNQTQSHSTVHSILPGWFIFQSCLKDVL